MLGLPSGPLLKARASNCSVRFGNAAPPSRAMPACGIDPDAVDLRVDHERGGFRRPADREIARTDARIGGHVHIDGEHVRRRAHDADDLDALSEVDVGGRRRAPADWRRRCARADLVSTSSAS